MLTLTPEPPYYAVIFASVLSEDTQGYLEMAEQMMALASQQQGFLGADTARDDIGITVSYWRDMESILNWKENASHKVAKNEGKSRWYRDFQLRIARVETAY